MSQQSTISVCVHEAGSNLFQTENIINAVFCTQYKQHTGYCVAEHTVGSDVQLTNKGGHMHGQHDDCFCLSADGRQRLGLIIQNSPSLN